MKHQKRSNVTLPKFLICICILAHATIYIFASTKVRQFRTGLFNTVRQRYLILVLFYHGGPQTEHADASGDIAVKIGAFLLKPQSGARTLVQVPRNTLTIWNAGTIKQKASFEHPIVLALLTTSRVNAIDNR